MAGGCPTKRPSASGFCVPRRTARQEMGKTEGIPARACKLVLACLLHGGYRYRHSELVEPHSDTHRRLGRLRSLHRRLLRPGFRLDELGKSDDPGHQPDQHRNRKLIAIKRLDDEPGPALPPGGRAGFLFEEPGYGLAFRCEIRRSLRPVPRAVRASSSSTPASAIPAGRRPRDLFRSRGTQIHPARRPSRIQSSPRPSRR